jgi:Lrp/AsnC family transcriptional regulator for asnA, asnC and gidA
MDEVIYVVVTAGSIDIVAEVIAKSDADLLTVSDQVRRIPGVQSTESFVYLETRKEVYNWGLPRPGERIAR